MNVYIIAFVLYIYPPFVHVRTSHSIIIKRLTLHQLLNLNSIQFVEELGRVYNSICQQEESTRTYKVFNKV